MEENKVLVLFARDEQGRINGIIHMHDILQGGIK